MRMILRHLIHLQGMIYILMEYLTPLEDYLEENDFRVKDVIKLGLEVLKGLRLCHENGIIHRDIKDDNISLKNLLPASCIPP